MQQRQSRPRRPSTENASRARGCPAVRRFVKGLVAIVFVVTSWGLVACGTFATPGQDRMSYAAMQSLNPGVSSTWLLEEYPFARNVARRGNGTIERMEYLVEDPRGDSQSLSLYFDERGVLTHKRYAGPHIRPPIDEERRRQERDRAESDESDGG